MRFLQRACFILFSWPLLSFTASFILLMVAMFSNVIPDQLLVRVQEEVWILYFVRLK